MKKLAFAIGGSALLALAGCSGNNQDAVSNAELNQPAAEDLNSLANDAATNAEDQSLGSQNAAEDLNATTVTNNISDPSDADEQNVSGM